jgi:ubiquinone/menaquinone biosynthesis C-methylase UbiE
MTPVKVQEIHTVRDALAGLSDLQDKWLEQFALVAKWINSFADEKARLLEIGCGSGVLSEYLTAQYAGIDPIEHKDLNKGINFKVGVGESIPHPDKSFNYVLIKDAIYYFSDLAPLFDEASRVLTEDGAMLITEFVGQNYHPVKQKLKNIVKKYLRIRRNIWDVTYLNYYTSHDVIKTAARRGLFAEYKYMRANSRYHLIIRKTHNAATS